MFKKAQVEGKMLGAKPSRLFKVILLLFVDDVLIMNKARDLEWEDISYIILAFYRASRLVINPQKYSMHYPGIVDLDLDSYKEIFPFNFVGLDVGFRYLGYYLKPANYRVEDWRWLLKKIEKRIGT